MRSTTFFVAAWLCASSVQAASNVTAGGVVLLQPDQVIGARVTVDKLAPYLKQVDTAATRALKATKGVPASGGFLVVAMRPGEQSKIWLDFNPPLPQALATTLVDGARAVPVPAVKGTVVVAMKYGVGGGSAPSHAAPSPAEWKEVAKAAGVPLEIGDLVERSWK
ncbi:hypothetical protein INH39_26355 [Massilia violaceinigra]|uniref:Uncharacterized protein n=1 Tax=Massilia violaceinigra TaxID=2045208 RepID=A0ABY4A2D6_9BURK|nr:hypothetical protein [Massilia violaceinigra]UOD28925.1 hypothetical protein INH39_26355 [Massilia violaceinigra]